MTGTDTSERLGAGADARIHLLAGVRASEHTVTAGGSCTRLLEAGGGREMVLLHGGIECGGVYWARVISGLAEHHRVIAPDVPGLGESSPLPRLDERAFGEWLAELLDRTCRERPVVIAHSLVGSHAARFARHHPDLLKSLVIYGTPGIGRYRMPPGLRLAGIRFAVRPTTLSAERLERWAFHDLDRLRGVDPGWLRAFEAYLAVRARAAHTKRAMRQLLATCTKRIPDSELAEIDVPTSLLWGTDDRFVPVELGERASSRLGWPLHLIDGAGHVPHIERPSEFEGAVLKIAKTTQAKGTP